MQSGLRQALKQFGLGMANLAIAIVLIVAVQAIARDRVSIFVLEIIGASIMVAVYLGGGRWIEHRKPPEFARGGIVREFAGGLSLGLGLFSVVMVLLWLIGIYHPAGWGSAAGLGAGAVFALMAAILEEIMFRGFLFRLIETLAGTWWALLATSALFGGAHALNRGATVLTSIAIALEAGVLLGVAYAATKRLWFPIGMHAAWNFSEGTVFGMSVSGLGASKGLIAGTVSGPAILTGGQFGPEASIVAVLVCFTAAGLLLWRTVRREQVQLPSWKRNARTVEAGAEFRTD
jgi:uncharacterized protein